MLTTRSLVLAFYICFNSYILCYFGIRSSKKHILISISTIQANPLQLKFQILKIRLNLDSIYISNRNMYRPIINCKLMWSKIQKLYMISKPIDLFFNHVNLLLCYLLHDVSIFPCPKSSHPLYYFQTHGKLSLFFPTFITKNFMASSMASLSLHQNL